MIEVLIFAIDAAVSKREFVQSLPEAVLAFCDLLLPVKSILTSLKIQRQTSSNHSSEIDEDDYDEPLMYLFEAIDEGCGVIHECCRKKKLIPLIFSSAFLEKLDSARSKIDVFYFLLRDLNHDVVQDVSDAISSSINRLSDQIHLYQHREADIFLQIIHRQALDVKAEVMDRLIKLQVVDNEQDCEDQFRDIRGREKNLRDHHCNGEILDWICQPLIISRNATPDKQINSQDSCNDENCSTISNESHEMHENTSNINYNNDGLPHADGMEVDPGTDDFGANTDNNHSESGASIFGSENNIESIEIKMLRRDAEHGNPEAQFRLGLYYKQGQDVEQSDVIALQWFTRAAINEFADGQNELGLMYQHGEGVATDHAVAVQWYRKAANQGHADGQNNLGWMCQHGMGIPRNDAIAFEWYHVAALQGNLDAQYNLGWMYEHGLGVIQDDTIAADWYMKAANRGDAKAQSKVGWMYEHGSGVNQSHESAIEWYVRAANQGNVNAQNSLGWLYEHGKGVRRNYSHAMEWYQKSANQGDANALFKMGWMYEQGKGVSFSREEAIKWYTEAKNQGNKTATKRLENILSIDKLWFYGH